MTTEIRKKRANYINSMLKDLNKSCEPFITDQVHDNDKKKLTNILGFNVHGKKCIYCCGVSNKSNTEEIIPITKNGRSNKMNIVTACGSCNSSKQDKVGKKLEEWLKDHSPNNGNKIKDYINSNINLLTINNNEIINNGLTYDEKKIDYVQYIDTSITNYNNKLMNDFEDNQILSYDISEDLSAKMLKVTLN